MNVIAASVINLFNSLPQELKQSTLKTLIKSEIKEAKEVVKPVKHDLSEKVPNTQCLKAEFIEDFNNALKTRGTKTVLNKPLSLKKPK